MAGLYSHARRKIAIAAKNTSFSGKEPSQMLYLGVGAIALLKDLLDLVVVGSFPGVGTLVTLCFTALIWFILTIFDDSGAKGNSKIVRSLVIVLFGLVEALGFGLNFLPIETGTVILLYVLARRAWKKEKKKWDATEKERQKREGQANARQIAIEQQRERAREEELRQVEEAANEAQYQSREAGNDAQYENNPQATRTEQPRNSSRMMSDMKILGNVVSQPRQQQVDSQFTPPLQSRGQPKMAASMNIPQNTISVPGASPSLSGIKNFANSFPDTPVMVSSFIRSPQVRGLSSQTQDYNEETKLDLSVLSEKEREKFDTLQRMKRDKVNQPAILKEAQEQRKKVMESRGAFQLSQEDFNQHFAKDEFGVDGKMQQQNVGDCYAIAAIHALSQSPSFEIMIRSSMKKLSDGSWEVRMPLMDKDAEIVSILPDEIQSQKNPGFFKRHGGIKDKQLLPDMRRKLDPVKAGEGYRVLEAAYIKSKFGKVNRLAAEGGQGDEVLFKLGGKNNLIPYSIDSSQYDEEKKKWNHPGLSSLSPEKMLYLDHMLEIFDPDDFITTVSSKHLDKSKLSDKVLDALGLSSPFYKIKGVKESFVGGHAYSLTKVDKDKKMVTLANPWDTSKPIELTFDQLKETFSSVKAVRIHHAKMLESMKQIHNLS